MLLGIDIGGTTGRVSALDGTSVLGYVEFPVTKTPHGDFVKDFGALVQACEQLASCGTQIEGVGLALAGKVNPARTMLTAAGNLGHWVGYPVAGMLSSVLGCKVVLGNDAEAAAMAEALYGNGRETDFWFVIWGTGVGGCLVRGISGTPVPFAGEPGHQFIEPRSWIRQLIEPRSRIICGCGQKGCLEAYCGGTGIKKRLRTDPPNLRPRQWTKVVEGMAAGIRNLVASQPVPVVVFGGGIANKQAHLLSELGGLLEDDLRIVSPPEIKLSAFGESAGCIGAAALIRLG